MTAMKFEDQDLPDLDLPDLDQYAVLAERYIPGRRAIFAIVEASFLELLPGGPAKILVVGAGGGEEILRLGSENPFWSFVGVDTYEPMVDLARRRLAASPVGPRSNVHAIAIEQLGVAFFEAIRARLKPGAPLAIVDGVGVAGEAQAELLRRIWTRHAIRNGVAAEEAEKNAQNFRKVAVVSAEREEELLTDAGFKDLVQIFRGLVIKGWLAFA